MTACRSLWSAPIVSLALIAAACTSSSGVTSEQSDQVDSVPPTAPETTNETTSDSSAPPETVVPVPSTEAPAPTAPTRVGAPTIETVAPDASGLPSLGEIDGAIVTGTLPNGLLYLIRQNDNPGRNVQMRLAVDAGSGVQDDDQGGGAHFLEHMLFNGTEKFPANELIAVLRSFGAAFGADINAYTSADETVYELSMPADDPSVVSTGLDVLQQWLSAATIDQDEVEDERGVVLDEWRRSTQTSGGRLFAQFEQFFLSGSRYEGRRTIGRDTEISTTDADDLRRYYDDWYRPDNAAIVVVGDIDPADIERQIVELFSSLEARSDAPVRPDLAISPLTDDRAIVLSDPDLADGFGFVTLPLRLDDTDSREAVVQRSILEDLAFDIIGTRLSNDALRGDAPFDTARSANRNFVRSLSAPEISFSADGADMLASTQTILDEYERVRRFGFTDQELARAVEARRSAAQINYDGRDSRQDASFADEYVRHFLEGESLPTAQRWFDYVNAVLDGATLQTVAHGFVQRFEAAGVHIVVAAPESEAGDLPSEDELIAHVAQLATSEIATRGETAAIGDALMIAPDPVAEVSSESLSNGEIISFVAPQVLRFENGVTVSFNTTTISEGVVVLEARSPGGLSAVADADVPAAVAAAAMIEQSGVGDFDPVALDSFLSDKEVQIDARIDPFTEGAFGFAATSDIETLFQLIHLTMTTPRIDQVALDRYLDDERPLAEDPSINPDYASFKTLLDARYDDPRFLLPTVEALDSVDADDALRVFSDRFGDASDWTFSFAGDFDVAELSELARRYLGTLPATGRVEVVDYVEPAPPAGIVEEIARAGDGERASLVVQFTAPASTNRRDDIASRLVNEIIQVRLTDSIREELGESYSPFAVVDVSAGSSPSVETYVQVSTGPDLIDNVTSATLGQLASLRADGPTASEFSSAVATLENELGLFSNQQINDEVLDVLVDPAGNGSFEEFLRQGELLRSISADDVQSFIEAWLPESSYISVTTLPR